MARKTKTVTIDAEGRDRGKVFLLTEMPASRAERWALRALLALGHSGVPVPPEIMAGGLAGVATMAFFLTAAVNMRFEDAEPLLDEMMLCVQAVPDPSRPHVVRGLVEDDIEELATRLTLRKEVAELHTGFFTADTGSIFHSSMAAPNGA